MLTLRRDAAITGTGVGVAGMDRVGAGVNRGRAVGSGVAVGVGAGAAVGVASVGLGAIVGTGVGTGVGAAVGAGMGVAWTTGVGAGVGAASSTSSPPLHIELITTISATTPTRMCNMSLSDLPFRQPSTQLNGPRSLPAAGLPRRADFPRPSRCILSLSRF